MLLLYEIHGRIFCNVHQDSETEISTLACYICSFVCGRRCPQKIMRWGKYAGWSVAKKKLQQAIFAVSSGRTPSDKGNK